MISGCKKRTGYSFDDIDLQPIVADDLKPGNELLCLHSADTDFIHDGVIYKIDCTNNYMAYIIDSDLDSERPYDLEIEELLSDNSDDPFIFVRWDNIDEEVKLMLILKYRIRTAEDVHARQRNQLRA